VPSHWVGAGNGIQPANNGFVSQVKLASMAKSAKWPLK